MNKRRKFLAAASDGNVEQLKKLLHQGMDVNTRDKEGNTALHEAANHLPQDIIEHWSCVTCLLEAGADPNVVNDAGWTPVMRSCYLGAPSIAAALVNADADLNAGKEMSAWALLFAHVLVVKERNVKEIARLLGEGVNVLGCTEIFKGLLKHGYLPLGPMAADVQRISDQGDFDLKELDYIEALRLLSR